MRRSIFAMLCLVIVTMTASSQLALVPSFGIESARPMVSVNNNSFIMPPSSQLRPQAGIRLDYKFKTGHGIFAGLSTSNTSIAFNFTSPELSGVSYFTNRPATQLRLEGGYQFTTKPLVFKNNAPAKRSCQQRRSCCSRTGSSLIKRPGCGMSMQRSSCCQSSHSAKAKQVEKRSMLSVRFQPQVGMAYIPSVKNDFETSLKAGQLTYTYNAGNYNTALLAGVGFEFAKGRNKIFQVNVQYLKGVGNLDNTTLTTNAGTKSTETNFASRVSAWKLSIGVPLSFSKSRSGGHCGAARKPNPKKHYRQVNFGCGAKI
ncbi:MAG: hypothetical protein ABI688_07490 [Bacteroidota bacterium]